MLCCWNSVISLCHFVAPPSPLSSLFPPLLPPLPFSSSSSSSSGTIDFNLTGIPEPVQEAADCSLDQLPPEDVPPEEGEESKPKRNVNIDLLDLFHKKRTKGWWPVFSSEEGERELMVSGQSPDTGMTLARSS